MSKDTCTADGTLTLVYHNPHQSVDLISCGLLNLQTLQSGAVKIGYLVTGRYKPNLPPVELYASWERWELYTVPSVWGISDDKWQ